MNPALASSRKQYATFQVGGHFLGIDVKEVQEVLREQRLTRCHWRMTQWPG